MNLNQYNNVGIVAIEIASVLQQSERNLTLSKALLISPIFSNKQLSLHLARKTTTVSSIERLMTEKTSLFSNFNGRFYDSLANSINAIQLLVDLKIISINQEEIELIQPLEYDSKMGKRVAKIYLASQNVASLLKNEASNLYLNLRIVL